MLFGSLAAKEQLRLGVICDLLPCHGLLGLGCSKNAFALKKALSDGVALLYGRLDKSTRYCDLVRALRAGSNNE